MGESEIFSNFLETGCTGILTPSLTLEQALFQLGQPEGRDVYEDMHSPITGKHVTQNNLWYGDLFLAFYAQDLYQYNFEVAHNTDLGLPKPLNAFWYDSVRTWHPKRLRDAVEGIGLLSCCYKINSEEGDELVVVFSTSKIYWFFIDNQLYKISWKKMRENDIRFLNSLNAEQI